MTRVLVVMPDMNTGGAQRSLISLLNALHAQDHAPLDITLALFKNEGQFLTLLPNTVRIIEVPCKCNARNGRQFAMHYLKKGRLGKAWCLAKVMLLNKDRKYPGKINQLYWETIKEEYPNLDGEYDVAIGYIDTSPTWYVAEKVSAKRKITFNRNDYQKIGSDPEYDRRAYARIDKIWAVSEECQARLCDVFPGMKHKFGIFHNITDGRMICDMAELPGGFDDEHSQIRILTVARTSYQKGIDLAYDAAKILHGAGVVFQWYILGRDVGKYRERAEKEGNDFFTVLPETDNPYPYMKQCDLYVQPSRWEGRCNTIIEAKILGKPVVCCNYPTVGELVNHMEDGLLTEISAQSLAQGIMRLVKEIELAERLGKNAARDNLSNTDQIVRFYTDLLGITKG